MKQQNSIFLWVPNVRLTQGLKTMNEDNEDAFLVEHEDFSMSSDSFLGGVNDLGVPNSQGPKDSSIFDKFPFSTHPIGSIYGIFTYIWLIIMETWI